MIGSSPTLVSLGSAAEVEAAADRPPSLGHTATIGVLSGINISLGVLQQWYILTTLGAGIDADALYSAFVVPNVLLANAMTPVTQVLVPLLSVQARESFREIAWTFFIGLGVLFGFVALLLGATAAVWVPWTVPGFDEASVRLTVALLRIQGIGIVFMPLSLILWSVYQARGRFRVVEASSALANLCVMLLLFWGLPRFGVAVAAAGFALKPALQTLFLARGMGRPRRPHWRAPAVHEAWLQMRPLFLGLAYCRTDQIVDRFFASLSPAGSITLLVMAQQVYAAANTILGRALVGSLVPTLASKSLRADWVGLNRLVKSRVLLLAGLGLLAMAGLFAVGRPLLGIVFRADRFSPAEIRQLWLLLLALGGSFVAYCPATVLSSTFYAGGDTRTPAWVSSAAYTVSLFLRAFLFRLCGVLGLALAVSLQTLLATCGLAYALLRTSRRRELSSASGAECDSLLPTQR